MATREKKPREYRGVQDEIHEQHLKVKDMTFKEKLAYFWDYYKYHTLAAILIVFFAVTLGHDILSAKDYGFYGVMLNSTMLSGTKMGTAFAEYAGIDTNQYDCFIDAESTLSYTGMNEYDMATTQRLAALVQTGDLDAVVFDSVAFNNYANNEMFLDLRTVLTKEELTNYQNDLYYVDYAQIEAANADSNYMNEDLISGEDINNMDSEDIQVEAEKHRYPEAMEKPVPVGIYITDSAFVRKSGNYSQMVPVFGFSATTTRLDIAKKYLNFLYDDSIPFENMLSEF